MQEEEKGQEEVQEQKTTAEMKKEFVEARQKEIQGYYSELDSFLKERNIDLDANVISGEHGNKVNIFIIDRL